MLRSVRPSVALRSQRVSLIVIPFCLSVGHSATYSLPRLNDWLITTKFGRQVYTCPRTHVSLFESPISHTLGARGKNMRNFAYFQCVFLPLQTWRIVPHDLSVCLSVCHSAVFLPWVTLKSPVIRDACLLAAMLRASMPAALSVMPFVSSYYWHTRRIQLAESRFTLIVKQWIRLTNLIPDSSESETGFTINLNLDLDNLTSPKTDIPCQQTEQLYQAAADTVLHCVSKKTS